jgi:hypothetical protein
MDGTSAGDSWVSVIAVALLVGAAMGVAVESLGNGLGLPAGARGALVGGLVVVTMRSWRLRGRETVQ